jgi:hypothetical protein
MSSRVLVTAVALIAAAMLLLWPAFFNHQPFFFPDTTAYARGADTAVVKLTGVPSAWTKEAEPESGTGSGTDHVAGVVPDRTVLAGRSIYYGALVYLGDRGGGEWLSIVIQSLLVVLTLFGTLTAFDLARWQYLLILVTGLAAFTALPLYASFLMPDVFTGLTILACAMLLTADLRGRLGSTFAWFVLLTGSLTFHTTHALLATLMFAVGLVLYGWRRTWVMPRGLAAVGLAVGVAYLFGVAFTVGVTRLMGEPPLTPPFLMARLIDDGPGYTYLRDTCPGSGFLVCRFVNRLPLPSDDFLWSKDPKQGVFEVSDPAVRRGLSREQYRFALAVILHEPVTQTAVSLRNAAEQMFLLKATEFGYTPEEKATFAGKLPAAYFEAMQTTPAYTGRLPLISLAVASYASTALGAGCLIFFWYSGGYRRHPQNPHAGQLARLTSWVVFGVLANAAVCGVMSGPHDRYQARVAWLIPAMALIAHFQVYRAWWENRLSRGNSSA